jgi:hypothetical protein
MASTEKVSVTLGRDELAHAKRLASHLGLSLSSFVNDAIRDRIRDEARREAARELVASFAPEERATPEEAHALLAHWKRASAARKPKSKSRGVRPRAR